ncbi:MAG TPA: chloride channel protein [Candidatus Thioglobus sp.]|nr:chloride channel protein [Candidatus Thioglobus sp.]HIL42499.1 chloride channel protein [Gammaproteobacteria bacterium]
MRRYILQQLPKEPKTYLAILIAGIFAVITIYLFIEVSTYMQDVFKDFASQTAYFTFISAPLIFGLIVYIDKKYFKFAGGSGIPQLIAATDSRNKGIRSILLSFKIAIVKIIFVALAMLGGASVGFGGPSVHIAGSIFYNLSTFIKLKRKLLIHSVIAIGGSAGLIVTFNAPIAGFLFAYEEIGRNLKKQALVLIAIICGIIYLFFESFFSDGLYLNDLSELSFELTQIWQLLPIAIIGGILGGIFAKSALFIINKFMFGDAKKTIALAIAMGSVVATLNYISGTQIAGTGSKETIMIISGERLGIEFIVYKYIATLASFLSTIAGGLFMPSISIGAGIGAEISQMYSQITPQVVLIMAMVAYLSGVIRTPLTSAFLVLEMTNSLNLLLPAIIISLISSMSSKQISKQPIYESIAQSYLKLTRN